MNIGNPNIPLISVALCTYNGTSYLEEQIMSIINQTYKKIELIVVDDCSTDNTNHIIAKLAAIYPQIKHYKNDENLGFNQNFQKAIKLTSGNFIAISDQDDIWALDKLELLINHIGDNWLVFSNSQFIDKSGHLIKGQMLADNFALQNHGFKSLMFSNFVTGHTVLFSKELVNYLLPIPKIGYYDWWIGFVALYHNKIIYLNKKLTFHRIHKKSVMYREKEIDKALAKKERYNEIKENLLIIKDYKGLNSEDKAFLNKIHFLCKNSSLKNTFGLLKTVFSNYENCFPDLKKRAFLSRLNFSLKFAKQISSIKEI
ncbi:MAG: glycosyltransferase [Sphingobacteriales bacterium]|nr:MAG: glycosyltransferase [Sphingobacteriales bacterium]TAF79954.1 MAG: glycosyltransferase [Sphingobacteriales bacterium]